MKRAIIFAIAFASAACAAAPDPSPSEPALASPAPVAALPPQTLETGQCGLFLFERRPPNRFVLFEDEASATVQIVHDGRIHTLAVARPRGAMVSGEAFSRAYRDDAHDIRFTLTGQVGEETSSGPRLEDVLLSVQPMRGARVVRPLGGVRSCGGEAG